MVRRSLRHIQCNWGGKTRFGSVPLQTMVTLYPVLHLTASLGLPTVSELLTYITSHPYDLYKYTVSIILCCFTTSLLLESKESPHSRIVVSPWSHPSMLFTFHQHVAKETIGRAHPEAQNFVAMFSAENVDAARISNGNSQCTRAWINSASRTVANSVGRS